MSKLTEKPATSASSVTNFITETANGLRKLSIAGLVGMFPKVQFGSVTITPSAANTPTKAHITFPEPFSNTPVVVVSPHTTVPGTSVTGCGAYGESADGCDIYLTRNNTTATVVRWVAVSV